MFSVPRNNVTMLLQLSNLNASLIVTVDPGQQPLPGIIDINMAVALVTM